MMILIDNYDSFSDNLARYIQLVCNAPLTIYKNDDPALLKLTATQFSHLIISPGPSNPNKAGFCLELLAKFHATHPILGICLGHQCIGQYFGANISQAKTIMHGKTSLVTHMRDKVFNNIPSPFTVTRYHSLVIEPDSMPSTLRAIAYCQDEVMAIKHHQYPIYGFQYHPEAYLTEHGHLLLKNFFELTKSNVMQQELACLNNY